MPIPTRNQILSIPYVSPVQRETLPAGHALWQKLPPKQMVLKLPVLAFTLPLEKDQFPWEMMSQVIVRLFVKKTLPSTESIWEKVPLPALRLWEKLPVQVLRVPSKVASPWEIISHVMVRSLPKKTSLSTESIWVKEPFTALRLWAKVPVQALRVPLRSVSPFTVSA